MKLGLKRGDTFWSSLNRYLLRTGFAHSAVEVRGRLYESTALKGDHDRAGVRDYPITPEISSQYVWIDLGNYHDEEALAAYELIRGHGYDYFSLIPFALPIEVRDAKREYCHELSALMMDVFKRGYITPEYLIYSAVIKFLRE